MQTKYKTPYGYNSYEEYREKCPQDFQYDEIYVGDEFRVD